MLERMYGLNMFYAMRLQGFVAVMLVAQMSVGMAASPAIGMATAKGSFRLDASAVTGTGTLFDGSTVETQVATSELKLSGARVVFDSSTRGKIYRDRVVLERGTGQVEPRAAFRIEASSLSIEPSVEGMAKVSVRDNRKVLVAALDGPVRIRHANGILLASVAAGRAVELEPGQAGAAAPSRLTGVLTKQSGHYLLADETLGITVEVVGTNLEKQVGNRVEILGVLDPLAKPAGGATQVVRIMELKSAGPAPALASTAGYGSSFVPATTAVILGVVVAGAATGLAVGLTRDEPQDLSR